MSNEAEEELSPEELEALETQTGGRFISWDGKYYVRLREHRHPSPPLPIPCKAPLMELIGRVAKVEENMGPYDWTAVIGLTPEVEDTAIWIYIPDMTRGPLGHQDPAYSLRRNLTMLGLWFTKEVEPHYTSGEFLLPEEFRDRA